MNLEADRMLSFQADNEHGSFQQWTTNVRRISNLFLCSVTDLWLGFRVEKIVAYRMVLP